MEIRKLFIVWLLALFITGCEEPFESPNDMTLTTNLSDNTILESSESILLRIELYYKIQEDIEVYVNVEGTAVEGVDYLPITKKIIIPAGYVFVGIPIQSIDNSLNDGTRNLIITISTEPEYSYLLVNQEDARQSIAIVDDEALISLSSEANTTPMQMVLKRSYSDLVNYEISSTEVIITEGSLVIEGTGIGIVYDLYLRPTVPISSSTEISYTLQFSGYQANESKTDISTFVDQKDLKLISFERDFDGIKILEDG